MGKFGGPRARSSDARILRMNTRCAKLGNSSSCFAVHNATAQQLPAKRGRQPARGTEWLSTSCRQALRSAAPGSLHAKATQALPSCDIRSPDVLAIEAQEPQISQMSQMPSLGNHGSQESQAPKAVKPLTTTVPQTSSTHRDNRSPAPGRTVKILLSGVKRQNRRVAQDENYWLRLESAVSFDTLHTPTEHCRSPFPVEHASVKPQSVHSSTMLTATSDPPHGTFVRKVWQLSEMQVSRRLLVSICQACASSLRN